MNYKSSCPNDVQITLISANYLLCGQHYIRIMTSMKVVISMISADYKNVSDNKQIEIFASNLWLLGDALSVV